jgi:hypothetical protein
MRRVIVMASALFVIILALSSSQVYGSPDALSFQTSWGAGQNNVPFGVGTDSLGNVFVAGTANVNKPPDYIGANGTTFLLKLDSHGSLVWQRSWTESSGLAQEYGGLLAVDSQGNAFVAASTPVPRSNPCEGTYSLPGILLLKFDTQGSLAWQKTFAGSCRLQAYQIVLSNRGNLFLTGLSWTQIDPSQPRSGGPFLMKLDSNGSLLWERSINSTICICAAHGVSVDSSENAVIMGDLAAKFNSTGSAMWEENQFTQISTSIATDLSGTSVSADNSGDIYETGNGLIVKLAPSGLVIWARQWDPAASPLDVQVDSSNNVFVAGSISNRNVPSGYNTFLIKLDSSGNLLGQTVWEGTTMSLDYTYKSMAADSNGHVFVAGVNSGSPTGNSHYASDTVKNATVYVGLCDTHLGCGLLPSFPASIRCACIPWPPPVVWSENIVAGQANGTVSNLNGQINPVTQNNVFLLGYNANELTLTPNNYLLPILLGGTIATVALLTVTLLFLRRRSHRIQPRDTESSKQGAPSAILG